MVERDWMRGRSLTCGEEEEGDEGRECGVQQGCGLLAHAEEVAEGAAGELDAQRAEEDARRGGEEGRGA